MYHSLASLQAEYAIHDNLLHEVSALKAADDHIRDNVYLNADLTPEQR